MQTHAVYCSLTLQPNYSISEDYGHVYGACAISHTTIIALLFSGLYFLSQQYGICEDQRENY